MKKKVLFVGLICVLLVFGFVACDNDPDPAPSFNGTWSKGTDRLVISGSNYTFRQEIGGTLLDVSRGTFTADLAAGSGSITINQTHAINIGGQLVASTHTETGSFTATTSLMVLSGFPTFPVNGNWTK